MIIRYLVYYILYVLYPPECLYCATSIPKRVPLCSGCLAKIQPVVSTILQVRKYHVPIFAVSGYVYPVRALILAKNYNNYVKVRALGTLIWELTYIKEHPVDVWIPIPLHWSRYLWRGFNQSEEIAQVLSQNSGKPVISLLKRKHRTKFQAECSAQERITNVKNVFELTVKDPTLYHNKHLVIVDDLATTGATLLEAARVLARLKPASIKIVVACRVQ